jgi:transcription elongation GreA/GreB family factor
MAASRTAQPEPVPDLLVALGPSQPAVTVGLPGTQQQFLFVHPLEAALDSVRISASSPLGRAVLGRRAGDLVDVASPAGRVRPAKPSA